MAYAKKIINVTYNKKSICFFAATEKETKQRSKKCFLFYIKIGALTGKLPQNTYIHTYTHTRIYIHYRAKQEIKMNGNKKICHANGLENGKC